MSGEARPVGRERPFRVHTAPCAWCGNPLGRMPGDEARLPDHDRYHRPCREEMLYARALDHFRRVGPDAPGWHVFADRARRRAGRESELWRVTGGAA